MNDLAIKNFMGIQLQRNKVELWAATGIYVIALFSLSTEYSPNKYLFEEYGVRFQFYKHYFWPQLIRYTLLYLGFLFLNFKVVPKLVHRQDVWLNSLLLLFTFIGFGFALSVLDTYTKAYLFRDYFTVGQTYQHIFQAGLHRAFWLMLMFGLYNAIRYAGLYLLANSTAIQDRYSIITHDVLTAFVLWMVSVFLLLVFGVEMEATVILAVVSLHTILFYCFAFYYLIPKSLHAKRPFLSYMAKVLLMVVILYLPIALVLLFFLNEEDGAFLGSLSNSAFQFFLVAPVIWTMYKRQAKGKEEVYVLKKELGRSAANLDFLRSQINPHFLFNALNTLYGTALQENSERTAQGIQMLGDMMRFMLHENHQQQILLSREIEYMRNYIELQQLRTSSSPDIIIETKIEDVLENRYIAPMLLIPFVENAFKHGISLQRKSWIRVSLHCDQDKVYFDVYNSTHTRSEQDPEKNKSGIGLENVRQRLNLLYPNRHELIIRETPEEYFVHLTLQL